LRFLLFLALIACASKPISGLKENEREDLQKVNYVLRKHKTDFFDCLAKTGEFTTNKTEFNLTSIFFQVEKQALQRLVILKVR
jgi:hypothetical protein